MLLVGPVNDNRWIYTMYGLEKPMEHVPAGGVMAGSVATLAVLWVSLQTMGLLGHSHSMGIYKIPVTLQNYLASYTDILSGLPNPSGAASYGGVIDTGMFQAPQLPPITEENLNTSLIFAQTSIDRMATLETNIAHAGVGLDHQSTTSKQYFDSYPTEEAFEKGNEAILAAKASTYLLYQNCMRFGYSKDKCARYMSTVKLEGTTLGESCAAANYVNCDPRSKYRTIDGSCNNLENPSWGRAMTAYTRILFPQYFDGIQEPRSMGAAIKSLPNARTVSTTLVASNNNDQPDLSRTLAVMQWTQFVSNDMAHTAVRKMITSGKPISCCRADGHRLSPRYIHPHCAEITVPDKDPVYGTHFVRCMSYVRSMPVLRSECTLGPIEQMNQATHFIDASTIYGSTLASSRELRTFEGGRLKVEVRNGQEFLPMLTGDDGFTSQCKTGCYNSGDDRVNVHPQLAVIHTVWHREHNRVAGELGKLNPHWPDEVLYQEARRIVIAEIQHITYKEWLPIVLGTKYVRATGLAVSPSPSYSRDYNSYDDPAVSNEAATAALRFFYSLMQGKLILTDKMHQINGFLELSEYFFEPRIVESDDIFDSLLRSLSMQSSQKMDINAVPEITSQFYTNSTKHLGLDAISLDIQRGRDHGLPGYNYYRRYCGLPVAKNFNDFLDYIPSELVNKLRSVYSHPNDVDLLVGGMGERAIGDGMLGPTFRCLISEQFARTRRTDRYFYDSVMQPYPFTQDQLAELHNVTLARIFCDNGHDIAAMQPNVFLKPQAGNEVRSCDDFQAIPSVDLFAWAEKAKAYR